MSYDQIWTAFDTALGGFTLGGDIALEGVVYQPIEGRPYLSSKISAYTRTPAGIGANSVVQEAGTYQVNVHRPADEGRTDASAMADQVVAFFPRGMSIVTVSGQTINVMITSAMPAITAGDWITVPVMVNWFASSP